MIYTEANRQDDINAIRKGVKVMLDRQLAAYDAFAAHVAETASVSIAVANKITGFYIKNKIVKYDGYRYVVKHGAFWDADVLHRAAIAADEAAAKKAKKAKK